MSRDTEKDALKNLAKAKRRTQFAIIGGVLILILLIFSFFYGRKLGKAESNKIVDEKVAITQDILHQQMEGIGELNTVRYYYTNMGRYENTLQFQGQTLPFTQKSFIISYDGTIKAGVELKDIQFELADKIIKVKIPEAKILSHDVDMASVTVFDEKNSIFNGLSTEDVTNFQREQEQAMEDRAITNGILTEAKENTKDSLTALFKVLLTDDTYKEGYALEFIQ